jgi:hypothetical protein
MSYENPSVPKGFGTLERVCDIVWGLIIQRSLLGCISISTTSSSATSEYVAGAPHSFIWEHKTLPNFEPNGNLRNHKYIGGSSVDSGSGSSGPGGRQAGNQSIR